MNQIKLIACIVLVMMAGGCTKNFEEINTNPSLVTRDIIQPGMLFTSVLKTSIFASFENSTIKEYSNYYTNEASGTIFQDNNWTYPFSNFQGTLINIQEVIRLTADSAEWSNAHAMAQIWKVWLFHQMTDAYGDLPYSEALEDVSTVVNQPKYDTQQSIYESMLNELKEAAAALSDDPSKASFGGADLLFNGDVDKWKRFANSLRLRLAIRVRYADAAMAQQYIQEVIGEPMIDDNSYNATLATLDGTDNTNYNPLYNDYVNSNAYPVWVGFTVTQELLKRDDPRLSVFVSPALIPEAGYRGRPMTLLDAEKIRYDNDSTATIPLTFQQKVYNIIVMNAAEVFLLRAEAALAGVSGEDAQEMYTKGITASLEQYAVPTPEATNYLASSFATLNGSEEEKLEDIIVQKYLAMYQQGAEAWAEYRRTGYPKIWTGSDLGSTNGRIPRRFTYPQAEYSLNNEHVSEAAGRLDGGDKLTSRMWWDAKPGLPFLHPRQGMYPPELY